MKRIKVLRIIARLNIGGPAIHAVLLTCGLDKTRFESKLICGKISPKEGDMAYYAAEKKVKPIFIPELRRELNLFNDLLAFIKIFIIIRTEQPEIIHTHTAKAGTLGRLAGALYNLISGKRAKLLHTFHGHIFSGYFHKYQTWFFVMIEKLLAYFTSKIITVSQTVKDELITLRITDSDKIAVIPLGFELEKFLQIPAPYTAPQTIGIVGRLVPIKNHHLFLEAAAGLIRKNPQRKIKFRIIGDGELRKGLEEFSAALGIADYVEFIGWQSDLIKVYSQLDIIALTSLNEGTPLSLIEAMASARAIVATNVGGVADLLGEGVLTQARPNSHFIILERGIIVKSNDSQSFSLALEFILKNNLIRENMAYASRNFARDTFNKDRLIKDTERLYEETLR